MKTAATAMVESNANVKSTDSMEKLNKCGRTKRFTSTKLPICLYEDCRYVVHPSVVD